VGALSLVHSVNLHVLALLGVRLFRVASHAERFSQDTATHICGVSTGARLLSVFKGR
jgi:hypothetical protein